MCKALIFSKLNVSLVLELPVFLFFVSFELFEGWRACLCYILSFGASVVCVSFGSVKALSSATKLFRITCCYYKYKLINGASVVEFIRPLTVCGIVSFVKRANLEWIKCFSVCLNFAFFLKLTVKFIHSIMFSSLGKAFCYNLLLARVGSVHEIVFDSALESYFGTAFFVRSILKL
ncbi:hypothetical protein AADW59_00365 [Candidatus Hodgkinia cicadicola]